MKINDSEINKLLDRAKNYRKDLSSPIKELNNFEDLNLEELQKEIQEERNKLKTEDKRNIFIQCKITEEEAKKGCTKKIKYNRVNKNGKKEEAEVLVKIPIGIENGQSIIMYGEGNYIKELDKNSLLIVEINLY